MINMTHAKWIEFLEQFPCVDQAEKSKSNVVANALLIRYICFVFISRLSSLFFSKSRNCKSMTQNFSKYMKLVCILPKMGTLGIVITCLKKKRLYVLEGSMKVTSKGFPWEGG